METSMSAKAEVIIIGGGVIGCSIAYHLSKEGVQTQIIEKNAIGSEASGMSSAVLAPLIDMEDPSAMNAEAHRAYDQLRLKSFRLHRHLHEQLLQESGVDTQYRQAHLLHLACTGDEERRLKAQIPLRHNSGLKLAWLDREGLKSLGAGLSPKVRGALCWYDQAEVEGYRLTLAYAQAAERRGVIIRQGTVTGIRYKGTRVTGVIVSEKEVSAGTVVLAMGPWSKTGGLWFGQRIPVEPVRGQIIVLEPASEIPPHLLFYGLDYVTPKANGLILVGGTFERVGFRNRVTQVGQEGVIRRNLALLPALAKTRMVRAVSGLRPVSADGIPIIGRLTGWNNAYIATGHGPAGINLSPITGQIIAELITKGHTDTAIDAFSPARFK